MKRLLLLIILTEKTSARCANTPDWKDRDGYGCFFYSRNGLCTGYGFSARAEYFGGVYFNFPEVNCCACGKTDWEYSQE